MVQDETKKLQKEFDKLLKEIEHDKAQLTKKETYAVHLRSELTKALFVIKCPKCDVINRVPRREGNTKATITCSNCDRRFIVRIIVDPQPLYGELIVGGKKVHVERPPDYLIPLPTPRISVETVLTKVEKTITTTITSYK